MLLDFPQFKMQMALPTLYVLFFFYGICYLQVPKNKALALKKISFTEWTPKDGKTLRQILTDPV